MDKLSMAARLGAEVESARLISLVEVNPVIWDRTSDFYQERKQCRRAWRAIAAELNPSFKLLRAIEQETYTKLVIKKWSNIRDHWHKNNKKDQRMGTFKRKFLYQGKLAFMAKVQPDYQPEEQQEPCELAEPTKSTSPLSDDDFEWRILTAIESRMALEQDRNLNFFKGILPSLQDFNEAQILEFQWGVLRLIKTVQEQNNGQLNV